MIVFAIIALTTSSPPSANAVIQNHTRNSGRRSTRTFKPSTHTAYDLMSRHSFDHKITFGSQTRTSRKCGQDVDETIRQFVCRHPFGNRSTPHHCGVTALRIGRLNRPSQDSSAVLTPPYDGLAFVVDPKTFSALTVNANAQDVRLASATCNKKITNSK